EFSAEAAGIFRVIQPVADPIQAATTETVTDDATDPPPLRLRRPTPSAAQSEPETLTIAASSRQAPPQPFGHTRSTTTASRSGGSWPPGYDHAACGGSEGEDFRMSGKNEAIKLVAGNSNPTLAQEIANYLNLPLTKAVVRRFADMEIFVEIQENVRGADVFVIQSTSFPANDHVMELLIIIDALRRSSARRITAVIPYFG